MKRRKRGRTWLTIEVDDLDIELNDDGTIDDDYWKVIDAQINSKVAEKAEEGGVVYDVIQTIEDMDSDTMIYEFGSHTEKFGFEKE